MHLTLFQIFQEHCLDSIENKENYLYRFFQLNPVYILPGIHSGMIHQCLYNLPHHMHWAWMNTHLSLHQYQLGQALEGIICWIPLQEHIHISDIISKLMRLATVFMWTALFPITAKYVHIFKSDRMVMCYNKCNYIVFLKMR